MNIKKTLFSAILFMGALTASAQDCCKTEYVFNPHWYVQAQGGAQYTLGEISFDKLISPNAQVAVGYNFNKVIGARLNVNAWQSRAGSKLYGNTYKWKYNFIAPQVDATFNLTNLLCKYNPKRLVNVGVFAGIGANISFNNDEACEASKAILANYQNIQNDDQFLRYIWCGTKTRLMGQVGANIDFRISDAVSVGLEISANTLNDKYNSKKAGNSDWYFNALAGVKINLGKSYTERPKAPCCNHEPKVIEKIVEKIVEKPVPVATPAPAKAETKKVEELRRDVFFTIKSTQITAEEMDKVKDVAEYLKANPEAKVTITGYADKGTGNAKINQDLSAKRANIVASTLQAKFGIPSSRIVKASKGDTEQPFAVNEQNRVSICIAK